MKITILTKRKTIRLEYTLSLIFDDRGIEWQLITDEEEYKNAPIPKFSYSDDRLNDDLNVSPSDLLFQENIQTQNPIKSSWNNIEIFQFQDKTDVLASVFYVTSLYDDFLQKELDSHGRNIGKNSILYSFGWLNQLIVERWSENLIQWIEKENNCSLNAQKIPFKIVPTFDIDHAFAYKERERWRKLLSIGKDTLKGDKKRLQERKEVLSGKAKDPYDTFAIIQEIAKQGFDVKVFWLLGEYSKFDKNISVSNSVQRALIKEVNQFASVGLHPSYQSNTEHQCLSYEKQVLETILQENITHSRQHFLKVKLPDTFERLEKVGFTDDYSLGYADVIGFRAGLARPFQWFNLKTNTISNLILHPISYMDGTLNEYMKLSIFEAIEIVKSIKDEVKQFGGEFIPLWHNETIGDYGIWKGWKEVLDVSLDYKTNPEGD